MKNLWTSMLLCLSIVACGGGGGGTDATSSENQIVDLGSIAFWSFDNMSGNSAPNTKFDGLPIVFEGASVVPGKFGNAVSFDETLSNSYGVITGNGHGGNMSIPWVELDFPDGISFAAWINPRKVDPIATYQIMGDGAFGLRSFSMRIENEKFVAIADFSNLIVSSTSSIQAGTWTHIAISYFGGVANLYVNGVLDSQRSVLLTVPTSRNPLYVGGRPSFGSVPGDFIFPGSIDEIYLSSAELKPTDLAKLMAGIRP